MTEIRPAFDRFVATRRFPLDGLRAVCVLLIVWNHTSGRPGPEWLYHDDLATESFFAVACFALTTAMLRERRVTGGISVGRLWARQALRALPLYYLVLLVYALVVAVGRPGTFEAQAFWRDLPYYATFTSNWFVDPAAGDPALLFGPLAAQMQFYLLWPPLLAGLVTLTRGRSWAPVTVLGALAVVQTVAAHTPHPDTLPWTIAASLRVSLLAAAALALVLNTSRGFALLRPILYSRVACLVLFTAFLLGVILDVPVEVSWALLALFLGALVVRPDTVLTPLLGWAPLVHLGTISYGVYLMHLLVADLVRLALPEQFGLWVFLATVPAVTIVATVSFRWFETPLLRLRDRFRIPARPVPAEV